MQASRGGSTVADVGSAKQSRGYRLAMQGFLLGCTRLGGSFFFIEGTAERVFFGIGAKSRMAERGAAHFGTKALTNTAACANISKNCEEKQ